MTLRFLFLTLLTVCLSASQLHAATDNPLSIEVWKSATCECCGNWVKHLEANGFTVKVNATEPTALQRLKAQAGIGKKLAACHTAKIEGYVIEGHVPASDIQRLIAERPEALGLVVPACPSARPEWSKAMKLSSTTCCFLTRMAQPRSLQDTELWRR